MDRGLAGDQAVRRPLRRRARQERQGLLLLAPARVPAVVEVLSPAETTEAGPAGRRRRRRDVHRRHRLRRRSGARSRSASGSTDADAPATGVLAAVARGRRRRRRRASSASPTARRSGLNALLQRRGAVVGLLVHRGLPRRARDPARHAARTRLDLRWAPPAAARAAPPPAGGARAHAGRRDGALSRSTRRASRAAVRAARARASTRSRSAFLNAWANPAHERRAAELAAGRRASTARSRCSHELSRQYREFERTQHRGRQRLHPAADGQLPAGAREPTLRGRSGDAALEIMRSGGGTMSLRGGRGRAVRGDLLGPGRRRRGGRPRSPASSALETAISRRRRRDELRHLPGRSTAPSPRRCRSARCRLPGAVEPGSTSARSAPAAARSPGVDAGGLLRVGPQQRRQHARPGGLRARRHASRRSPTPRWRSACSATASSAGGLRLDARAARGGASSRLAGPLGLEADEAARGILTVACAGMADAIREITVERGHDPRDGALVAFGGAGPLFGTLLADELELDVVVVPPLAGNFSAWGLLGAPRRREASQTLAGPLDAATLAAAGARGRRAARGPRRGPGRGAASRLTVDVRYRGQEQAVGVPLPAGLRLDDADAPAALDAAFREAFRRAYLHEFGGALELIAVRVAVERPTPALRLPPLAGVGGGPRRTRLPGVLPPPRCLARVRRRRAGRALARRRARRAGDRRRGDGDHLCRRRLRGPRASTAACSGSSAGRRVSAARRRPTR